ncbi:protein-S-isoprenylcysteine O-methyltransferase [candidate division KSB1 bacterium]
MGKLTMRIWVIRLPHWWRDKQKIADDRTIGLNKLLMTLNFVGMQVIPVIYLFTPWLDFADYRLPTKACLVFGCVGAAIFAAALWLLWRSHADLGCNFSPELQIRKEHSLITGGVYRYIRHPMYSAHWLWGIAQALLLQNWVAGLVFMAVLLPLYLLRVPHEEQLMLEHFGEEYRLYMNRSSRIIPRLQR